MTSRELPRSEWARLADTALARIVTMPEGSVVSVFVVEDEDGRIVGCWSLMTMLHAEGLWIHPDYRARVSVGRRLLGALWARLRLIGTNGVWTAAETDDVARMLERIGAVAIPIRPYYWPVTHAKNHDAPMGANEVALCH